MRPMLLDRFEYSLDCSSTHAMMRSPTVGVQFHEYGSANFYAFHLILLPFNPEVFNGLCGRAGVEHGEASLA